MKNRLLAVGAMVVLAASLTQCEQHYRYACQDPANWDQDYCKKPLCEVNRDCPEYIFKEDSAVKLPQISQPAKPIGECK